MTDKFISVQLGPHSVVDEGVDHVLDTLQRTARVNALLVYTHRYHGYTDRPIGEFADHGFGIKDPSRSKLTRAWVPPHDQYYGGTYLRNMRYEWQEYHNVDVLEMLREPTRKRGMQLCARLLENPSRNQIRLIPNWPKVLEIDVFGNPLATPCFNHPDYLNWWLSTVEDLFKSYELEGFMFGQERRGPLGNLVVNGDLPACFCEHCQTRARNQGINVARAIAGYEKLYEFIRNCLAYKPAPVDGYFVTFLRLLLRYPELLAWEYMWFQSREDHRRRIRGTIKAINPAVHVGWHIYHTNSWSPLFRAEMDYSKVKRYADWLKPVVYHDCLGQRFKERFLDRLGRTIFRDVDPDTAMKFLYSVLQYDEKMEPTLAELETIPIRAFSSDYVYREVKRCVDGVNDEIPVYAGIGFNVPTPGNRGAQSTPQGAYDATYKSFEAGAKGLVISREYDEMTLDNLNAVGRAIDDFERAH